MFANYSFIRTGTARAAEKSSFLSREKAEEIVAKYLDNLSKKPENGKWASVVKNAPEVGLYALAFKHSRPLAKVVAGVLWGLNRSDR